MAVNTLQIDITTPPGTPPRPPGGGPAPTQPGPGGPGPGGGGTGPLPEDVPPWMKSLLDSMERMASGKLSYTETMRRAEAIAARHGQTMTDYGRDNGILGPGQTGADFARHAVYQQARDAGMDVRPPLEDHMRETIEREQQRHAEEKKRFDDEAKSREEERKSVEDTLKKDFQARADAAVKRHNDEQKRMAEEAANRDGGRKAENDRKSDMQRRIDAAVDRHNSEQKRMAAEGDNRDKQREKEAKDAKDAKSDNMARMRTIAGGAQTMLGGGQGLISGGMQIASTGALGEGAADRKSVV